MLDSSENKVLIVGAGLAGSDAAYFLASNGIKVVLAESKKVAKNPAQKIETAAELVCTNSLKSKDENSAHGLLKREMQALNSLVIDKAYEYSVPAGDALAVDRDKFSKAIDETLRSHENIEFVDSDVENPDELAKKHDCQFTILASGPLTTEKLTNWIQSTLSKDDFYFYDAIAPVVDADSLDMSKLYFKDRHKILEEGIDPDYLNAPLNQKEYEEFVSELVNAEKVPAQGFEEYKYFESCLPIDTMAERGKDTPRFSCMKPIGLEMEDGNMPYACVQLRKENLLGSAYNMVGFQTRLTYKEQLRVFRMIPGMEEAQFLHLGSVHRNSFINARALLNEDLSAKEKPNLFFAGQITGVEGYTESASMGLYVGWQILRRIQGKDFKVWPKETAIGALVNYIMTVTKPSPSNINMGLLPPVLLSKEERRDRKNRKRIKKKKASLRAKEALSNFLGI